MRHSTNTAFSPGGISSFFEICDQEEDGSPIKDPARIGSRGGGFGTAEGVTTETRAKLSGKTKIKIYINGENVEAKTTETMIKLLLKQTEDNYSIEVKHSTALPIGSGFGTSAAGAYSCGLALSQTLGLNLTYNHIGRMAHVADVVCYTGLGTVEGLMVGGLVLIVKSGAAGIGLVDRIPIPPNLKIVAGAFKPMEKSEIILSPKWKKIVNKLGAKAMNRILKDPNLRNFLDACKDFAFNLGLMSDRVKQLILEAEEAGAIGATQNMLGEAVHAITTREKADAVYDVFRKYLPENRIINSAIDFQGGRIIE
ncbi:hypothetical protein KAX03_01980 [Candidatus Bathyarchaeota archaeon]|nr:hypothetical protein [Candidatus Bathyarchaeota archaeon]